MHIKDVLYIYNFSFNLIQINFLHWITRLLYYKINVLKKSSSRHHYQLFHIVIICYYYYSKFEANVYIEIHSNRLKQSINLQETEN